MAPVAVSKAEGPRAADLSEAHALARLVTNVSQGLLCYDLPRISGFVETDAGQVISPARLSQLIYLCILTIFIYLR